KGSEQTLEAASDGGIADAQLPLQLLEVPARAQEALQEGELLALEAAEAADAELALQRRAAAPAVESRDGELALAHRTGGDDVACHLTIAVLLCRASRVASHHAVRVLLGGRAGGEPVKALRAIEIGQFTLLPPSLVDDHLGV